MTYSITWFCSFWSTVDGAWSSWGAYGTCSVTCGGGTQSRTRTCTNPTPQYGGAACPGTDTTSQDCNTQICISEFIAKGFLYDFQFALLICTKIKKKHFYHPMTNWSSNMYKPIWYTQYTCIHVWWSELFSWRRVGCVGNVGGLHQVVCQRAEVKIENLRQPQTG